MQKHSLTKWKKILKWIILRIYNDPENNLKIVFHSSLQGFQCVVHEYTSPVVKLFVSQLIF